MKWYPRDADAFIAGTIGLTSEEVGASPLVRDGLYSRNGRLPDDERYICRLLRCDPRVWRRIRGKLLGLGKLEIADGFFINSRATTELGRAQARLELAYKAGHSSSKKRKQFNEIMASLAGSYVGDTYNKKKDTSSFLNAAREGNGVSQSLAHSALVQKAKRDFRQ